MAKSLIDERWSGLTRPVLLFMTLCTNFSVSFSMKGANVCVNSLLFANDKECTSQGSESTANFGKSNGLLFGVMVVVTLLYFEKTVSAYRSVCSTSFL